MLINNFTVSSLTNDFGFYGVLNGKKCFVENAIMGDIVNINVKKETKDFYVAEIVDFVKMSPHRIQPQCKYFGICGGCAFQNINNNFYYDIKLTILKNLLQQNNIVYNSELELIKIDIGKRRRVNLKYSNGKFGFEKVKTNDFVAIDSCLNVETTINIIIEKLSTVKFKNLISVDILSLDNQIGINLYFNKTPIFQQLEQLENALKDFQIGYIFYRIKNENIFIPVVNNGIFLNLKSFRIKLPNHCFLQATKESQENMIDIVLDNSKGFRSILDLYCGIGTYSFPLSKIAKITAVEGDDLMIKNLKENIIANNVPITAVKQDLFNQPFTVEQLNKFDLVVINPPRNGAENQCKILSKSNVKKIIYVSCNPKTLVRDLQYFSNSYQINKIIAIDQFYWSKHLECVMVLEKI